MMLQFVSLGLIAKIDPPKTAKAQQPIQKTFTITAYFEASSLVEYMGQQARTLDQAIKSFQLVSAGQFNPQKLARHIAERVDRCHKVMISDDTGCGIEFQPEPTEAEVADT